jgi:hypothetical protein
VEERRTRDVLASAGHMLQRSHATVGWAATELLERQRRLAAAESEAATRAHGFGAKADMANLGLVAAQVRGGSRGNTNMGTKVASVGHLSPDGFVHHSIAIRGAGRTTARAAGQSAAAGALGWARGDGKRALERGTKPTRSRRTCSSWFELQSLLDSSHGA